MTLHKPLWAQNETYPAATDRQLLAGVFGDEGTRVKGLRVMQRGAGANMSVDVSAGRVAMPGPSGPYLGYSDAVENRAIAAAPAVGTTRRDLVYAEVTDPQAMGSGTDVEWDIKVASGVAAASNPALPATPAWATPLAEVTVASGTLSITDSLIGPVGYNSSMPRGVVGTVVRTDSTATVAASALPLYTLGLADMTLKAGRNYRVYVHDQVIFSTLSSAAVLAVFIQRDSGSGHVDVFQCFTAQGPPGVYRSLISDSYSYTPQVDETSSWRVRFGTVGGSSLDFNVRAVANGSNQKSSLTIVDEGAAF